jgi:dimethylaniline monooxygenase (N-oxide forming)
VAVYEKHAAVGGVWNPGSGGAYPLVGMQSSRMSFPFSGFRSLATGDFRSLHRVHEYLTSFAATFGVFGVTRLRHQVVWVAGKGGGGWQVTACPVGNLGAAVTEDDPVMVAQGDLRRPRRLPGPPPAGIRALIAEDYRMPPCRQRLSPAPATARQACGAIS